MPPPRSTGPSNDGSPTHACCLYQTEAERTEALNRFLLEGLERGEKLICAFGEGGRGSVGKGLAEVGVDLEPLITSGQLVLVPSDESRLGGKDVESGRSLEWIASALRDGGSGGYSGMRFAWEVGWLLEASDPLDAFLRYEGTLQRSLEDHTASALCMYDRRALSAGSLLRCLELHSSASVDGVEVSNPYVMTADDLEDRDPISAEVAWRRRAIEVMEAAALNRDLLAKVMASLDSAVFVVGDDGRAIVELNRAAETMFGYSRAELTGAPTRILHVDEAHWREFGELSRKVLSQGSGYRADFEMRRSDRRT